MPSPEVLDFEKLLAPIPGDKATGVDLRGDSAAGSPYYAVKDARSAARAAERQMVVADDPSVPPPDWKPVLQSATKALAEKTKDLEITAYQIEALLRLKGFAGLRDGFRLARELVDKYWDDLYPMPDEEGVTTRVAALTGLNGDDAEGTLITPIARVPLTGDSSLGAFSKANYQEAVNVNKTADPKARDKKIAEGAVSFDKIEKAVAETPAAFFINLVDDLNGCQEEFGKLSAALSTRCGEYSPPTSNIREALTGCLDVVKDIARTKLPLAEEPAAGADGEAQADGAAPGAAQGPGEAVDVIRNREDAFRNLLKVADFFRRTEPHTVISYTLEQVVRWGRLPLPDLLAELIPDEDSRRRLFKQVGIKPPESEG
jgi:type VI secretion system protein ImpA